LTKGALIEGPLSLAAVRAATPTIRFRDRDPIRPDALPHSVRLNPPHASGILPHRTAGSAV